MADSKISALPAVTAPASTDEFAVNQAGASKKMTLGQIHTASGQFIVTDYGAISDGTTDATAAIQSAIDAATAGGVIFLPAGTYLISDTLDITVPGTTLHGSGAVLSAAAGLAGKPMVKVVNTDYCGVTEGVFFLGNWRNGTSAVDIVGCIGGAFDIRGDQLWYGVRATATAAAGADRNVAMCNFDVIVRNGVNGMVFEGDGTYFASNNNINRVSWWGAASVAGVGLDFVAYADNNRATAAFLDVTNAGSKAVVFNSSSVNALVGVYENHLEGIIQSEVGATAIDGNRTESYPTRVNVRLAGGTPPTNDIQANCVIVTETTTGDFVAPTFTLGTAAAAGSASTSIRSDATIAAFDATVPVTQAFSDAAAAGSAAVAARRDHVHGMPAAPSGGITTVFVWADDMSGVGGSTAGTNVNRWLVRGFDAAGIEYASKMVQLPDEWATFNVALRWANGGAGAGDVGWTAGVAIAGTTAAESLTSPSFGATTIATAGGQNVVVNTALLTGAAPAANHACLLALRRDATDAGDTLANDANAICLVLTKAS